MFTRQDLILMSAFSRMCQQMKPVPVSRDMDVEIMSYYLGLLKECVVRQMQTSCDNYNYIFSHHFVQTRQAENIVLEELVYYLFINIYFTLQKENKVPLGMVVYSTSLTCPVDGVLSSFYFKDFFPAIHKNGKLTDKDFPFRQLLGVDHFEANFHTY